MADAPDRNERRSRAAAVGSGPVTIEDFTRLSGGASRETWSFDAVGADGTRTGLILRRDPPGRPGEPGAIDREAGGHQPSRTTPGCRCRRCCSAPTEPRPVAAPPGMIMRRVEGETIARRILRDDEYAQARGVLVGQLGQFAAGLHALDVPDVLPAARSAGRPARAAGRVRGRRQPARCSSWRWRSWPPARRRRASRCCCTATSGSAT